MSAPVVISVLALIVSVISAGTAIVVWRLNGPRLAVEVITPLIVPGPGNPVARGAISVHIVNHGRASTVINYWDLTSDTSTAGVSARGWSWQYGPDFPHVIEPDQTVVWHLDLREVESHIKRHHPHEQHRFRVRVVHGNRTTWSRSRVSIPSEQPKNTWWRVRLRDSRRISLMIWGSADGVVVENTHTMPARNVRTDLVVDDDALEAEASEVQRRSWLLPGRKQTFRWLPGQFDESSEWWVRVRWQSLTGTHSEQRSKFSPQDVSRVVSRDSQEGG